MTLNTGLNSTLTTLDSSFGLVHDDIESKLGLCRPLSNSQPKHPYIEYHEAVLGAQSDCIDPVLTKSSSAQSISGICETNYDPQTSSSASHVPENEQSHPPSPFQESQLEYLKGMGHHQHSSSYLANHSVGETARRALRYMQNDEPTTQAEINQEHSLNLHSTSPTHKNFVESQTRLVNTAVTTSTAVIPSNIAKLREQVSSGEIPSLMPAVYDETDKTLTWHSQFGKFFRHSGGVWERWDEEKCCWLGGRINSLAVDSVARISIT